MKIAIITQYDPSTVNYGNVLQTYALNRTIQDIRKDDLVETVILSHNSGKKRTRFLLPALRKIFRVIKVKKVSKNSDIVEPDCIKERRRKFRTFAERNIRLTDKIMTLRDLESSDYDLFVVGSDVVWAQSNNYINRIKFLDFETKIEFKRIAYAASFGGDWIPKENIKYIREFLKRFNSISVREQSSVSLLKRIGIDNVYHVADPTLLINKESWEEIERKPKCISENENFVFMYILSEKLPDEHSVSNLCEEFNCHLFYVPCADGLFNPSINYKDARQINCSPEEWLWLIHNAKAVITDSFHAVIFSTIFNTKFIALPRIWEKNINNRIEDFLIYSKQEYKMCNFDTEICSTRFDSNFDNTNAIIEQFINDSREYLINCLTPA